MKIPLDTLKVFGDKDEITVQDLYGYFGIDVANKRKATAWMQNKLSYWRSRGLVQKIMARDRYHRLVVSKIRLTPKGREELGRPRNDADSISDVLRLVSDWSLEHPEYIVTFEIKLKEGGGVTLRSGDKSSGDDL